MDAHEKKNSSFDDREVDSHHQLAPAPDWKGDSFNQRLYWLQEGTSLSDDSETTLKPSLKRAVSSPRAFWPWEGMMWWASPCQASASDWETLSYEEAMLPGFWLPGQRNPSASQYYAEWFSTTQVPQTPAVGPMLSSKCGPSVSSALGRKTVWNYSYFLHRRMSIKCNTLLSQSASCQSSHRSQNSVQE